MDMSISIFLIDLIKKLILKFIIYIYVIIIVCNYKFAKYSSYIEKSYIHNIYQGWPARRDS